MLPIVERLADEGSVTVLRERFAPELVTALARIEGRPVGVIADDTRHLAGTVTGPASDKAALVGGRRRPGRHAPARRPDARGGGDAGPERAHRREVVGRRS